MEPVVGPLLKTSSLQFGDVHRTIWRQRPPFDRPLPYNYGMFYGRRYDAYYNSWSGENTSSYSKEATFSLSSHPRYYQLVTAATNKAYERLKGELGSTAGWAENLAQIQKSRQMVSGRLVQLSGALLAVKAGKFKRAAKLLRTVKPSGVSNRKALSQNFLEFEFGWKPIVKDIQESLEFLTADFPVLPKYIKGSAKEALDETYTNAQSAHQYYRTDRSVTAGMIRVKCRAGYFVSNPNAFLANQLGVLDTALPWKLIPFSFIVDWFINVEQVLSSMTDFYGVTLVHPNWTVFAEGTLNTLTRVQTWDSYGNFALSTIRMDKRSVEMGRQLGLPSPVPQVRPFKGFSMHRGLLALSLVLSVLGK